MSSHHDLFISRKSKTGCLQQFRALREYLHMRWPPYLKLWPWAFIAYMCDRITASICDSVIQTERIHWTTEVDTERSKKAVSRQQSGMLTLRTSSSELNEQHGLGWPAQCPGRAPDDECCNTSIPLALLIHTTVVILPIQEHMQTQDKQFPRICSTQLPIHFQTWHMMSSTFWHSPPVTACQR